MRTELGHLILDLFLSLFPLNCSILRRAPIEKNPGQKRDLGNKDEEKVVCGMLLLGMT